MAKLNHIIAFRRARSRRPRNRLTNSTTILKKPGTSQRYRPHAISRAMKSANRSRTSDRCYQLKVK